MLKPSRSHQDYIAFVRRQVAQVSEPAHHLPAKAKLLLLDLTLAISIRLPWSPRRRAMLPARLPASRSRRAAHCPELGKHGCLSS